MLRTVVASTVAVLMGCGARTGLTIVQVDDVAADAARDARPVDAGYDAPDLASDVADVTDAGPCQWVAGDATTLTPAMQAEYLGSVTPVADGVLVGANTGNDVAGTFAFVTHHVGFAANLLATSPSLEPSAHAANEPIYVASGNGHAGALVEHYDDGTWWYVGLDATGASTGVTREITDQNCADLNATPDGFSAMIAFSNPAGFIVETFDTTGAAIEQHQATGAVGDTSLFDAHEYDRAMNADGSFVLAWVTPVSSGVVQLLSQAFDSHGVAAGSSAVVESAAASMYWVELASVPAGLIAAWMEQTTQSADPTIHLRALDADGQPTAAATLLPISTICSICGLDVIESHGDLLLAWLHGNWMMGSNLFVQPMTLAGAVRGAAIMVATFGAGSTPFLSATPAGALVVYGHGGGTSSSDWAASAVALTCAE